MEKVGLKANKEEEQEAQNMKQTKGEIITTSLLVVLIFYFI